MNCPSCGAERRAGARFCESCGAELAVVSREQRKVVTVLFCDVVGSTALGESTDPEALRALLARYFERMKGIVERHGGTVEKFIGDAVMAVFGVPVLHEDDALRACRAAVEMREAFGGLGVEGRIGVATGEVVAGTAERLATGDAVNVAARLEETAAPGEILVDATTRTLVARGAKVEPVEPLTLKGKERPVVAFRLVAVAEPVRPEQATFVGRERERRLLADAFEFAVSERACHLFTVLGVPGVGKSRLAGEFLRGLDATVVRGRCLSYGEGITYWPVVEVVKRLRSEERELERTVARPLAVLLGSDESATTEEIAFAVRRLFEAAAQERPLVVVWDDVQWGEEAFLDLVEHVAEWSRDAPILLLCLARPELLERRSGWGGGKLHATNALVGPLGREASAALLEALAGDLPETVRASVDAAAAGNPLFVEEMVAMARGSRDGEFEIPPTIKALLAARLDQLPAAERETLECGAVEGEVFHDEAVEALGADVAQLALLLRKDLIRPEQATLAGEQAHRFRHILIRDATYDALPKSRRAELHERLADWLERRAPGLVELDELVGYHLEQAHGCRHELGDNAPQLAKRAALHLQAAGERALRRYDNDAAANLIGRTLALLPEGVHLDLRLDLANALFFTGDARAGTATAGDAAARAAAAGDLAGAAAARLVACGFSAGFERGAIPELPRLVEALAPVIEHSANVRAQLELHIARLDVLDTSCRSDGAAREALAACELARHAGRLHLVSLLTTVRLWHLVVGSPPLSAVDSEIKALPEGELVHFHNSMARVLFEAMRDVDAARELFDHALQLLEERKNLLGGAGSLSAGARIELLAGDAPAAARWARAGVDALGELGATVERALSLWVLADALTDLGEVDDADRCAEEARDFWSADDVPVPLQLEARRVCGRIRAARGEHETAEQLAREATAIALTTEQPIEQALTYATLAEVLARAGKLDEAREEREIALELCRQKQAPTYIGYINRRLDALLETTVGESSS